MKLRQGSDAILVGVNTVLADDPSLTVRAKGLPRHIDPAFGNLQLRRIVLDSMARTPLKAKIISDNFAALTTIVVSKRAPKSRITALAKRVNVIVAPAKRNSSFFTPSFFIGPALAPEKPRLRKRHQLAD